MSEILVSVCCVAYNHAPYIDRAVEGFLAQRTRFAYEVILHDDASTDGTAEAIRRWAALRPDLIRPILQTENQHSRGISVMELALAQARGRYIALCEGDDCWTSPDKLEKQVQYLQAHPDCSLCLHAADIIDPAGKPAGVIRPYRRSRVVDVGDLIRAGGGFAATSSYVYPLALRRGGLPAFCHSLPGVGDSTLHLYLATQGHLYYLDERLSCYRRGHAGSWTTGMRQNKAAVVAHVRRAIEMLRGFDEYSRRRWHGAVRNAIANREIDILELSRNYSEVWRPPLRKAFFQLTPARQARFLAKYALSTLRRVFGRNRNG
ncbi:MAG: glycosyltransferase [Clostridiales bacterium]|nr:glycosyltransferase [Clostridiales bacterium]